MATIEEINNQIRALSLQKMELESAQFSSILYDTFCNMTKEEVLAKLDELMRLSPMLKAEVKRLLNINI